MKTRHIFNCSFIICMLLLAACKDDAVQINGVDPIGAKVRFYNFAVNGPGIIFYSNDTKVSAVSSLTGVESSAGLAFGGLFPALNYCILTSGNATIKAKFPATAATDANLATATLPVDLALGKNYSIYTSGFYNTTAKTSDAFMVEDQIPAPDTSGAYVRLVHAISNTIGPVNLVAKNTTTMAETIIATNVAYKSGSAFFKLPQAVYDLFVRYPSSATNIITRTSVSFIKGQAYTISTRGDITVVSTTAANRPFLDNTVNR